ncbi:hypothetical protein KK060_21535 [Fulvivirgaceae bacterium PWU20]|uniref:Uncharacterized protein n=1 Tax=Chryseosolibacter indicus TaxID=2782351 RepID=A0ABS5VWU0_9BACT|nr:hypothetical protein [Chryseosolibacter indicus]
MKKVTKKSRHKNASTAQGRATARFYVGPTRLVLIIDLAKESNIRKAQALSSASSFPACNRDYKKLKEAARESPGLAIVTMKCCCLKL